MDRINHPKEAFRAAHQLVRLMDKGRPEADDQEQQVAFVVLLLDFHCDHCDSAPLNAMWTAIDVARSCVAEWEYACYLERRA